MDSERLAETLRGNAGDVELVDELDNVIIQALFTAW